MCACPLGFWIWWCFCEWFCVHLVFIILPFLLRLISLILDHFNPFFLCILEQWCETNLFTEGNQSIPHELVDRDGFVFRSQELRDFRFPLISEIVRHYRLWFSWSSILATLGARPQNSGSIGADLIEFWSWIRFFRSSSKYRTCPVFSTFEFWAEIWWRPSLGV